MWFDVIRSNETGQFRDTKYEVKKVQTKVREASGKVSFVDDRSPLPDSVVENYDNLGYDLSAIYQTKTYEDLQQILDANLPGIIELVPDADLNVEPSLAAATAASKPAARAPAQTARPATTGTSRVAIKLDDAHDDDAAPAPTKTTARAPAPAATKVLAAAMTTAVVEDDFMTEADRILNS